MNFSLSYDPAVVRVDKVEAGTPVRGALFRASTQEAGIIRFGVAVQSGEGIITGDGPIAHVGFVAVGSEGTASDLTLGDPFARDVGGSDVGLDLEHGLVVIEERRKGDHDGDGCVTSDDALAALRMSVGELADDLIMDVDDDARVTAEDARLILREAAAAEGTCPTTEGTVRPSGDTESLTELPGDPDADAAGHIPDITFEPRAEDYSDDHPELEGIFISFNTLMVLFTLDASVEEVNSVLGDIDAEIVGTLPGVPGEAQGILIVRIPSESHGEMSALIDALDADPLVEVAVQDALMESLALPGDNGALSPGAQAWTWEREDEKPPKHEGHAEPTKSVFNDGNWGLELIRVPQMWNLNAAIKKAGGSAAVGVLDMGFAVAHEDLDYRHAGRQHFHGTHVAGTIGATFDNGKGIDGINPFATLRVKAIPGVDVRSADTATKVSKGATFVNQYRALIRGGRDLRVVNISLGFNFGKIERDADLQKLIERSGRMFVATQKVLVATQKVLSHGGRLPLPTVVVAAGNDSDASRFFDARWSSPFTYAGLVLRSENVIVVESIDWRSIRVPAAIYRRLGLPVPEASLAPARSVFSNVKGDVSAPGSDITSSLWSDDEGVCAGLDTACYGTIGGTSMAAPHVTGVISYLYSIDPTLTHADIRKILLTDSVPVEGGAKNRIDAFNAVMNIDLVQDDDDVRKMLLDIDDGTPDGNQLSGDGDIGDGAIDMSDFRRWRDWLLITEGKIKPDPLAPDAFKLPKNDVNGNRKWVTDGDDENVFPRGDFNGDGKLDRTTRIPVSGKDGGGTWTDLEVMRDVFEDEHYDWPELKDLIDSWDLEVSASECLALDGVAEVRSWVEIQGSGDRVESIRTHAAGTNQIYTIAAHREVPDAPPVPIDYRARLQGLDSEREVVVSVATELTGKPGEDRPWRPDCEERPPDDEPEPGPEINSTFCPPGPDGYTLFGAEEDIEAGSSIEPWRTSGTCNYSRSGGDSIIFYAHWLTPEAPAGEVLRDTACRSPGGNDESQIYSASHAAEVRIFNVLEYKPAPPEPATVAAARQLLGGSVEGLAAPCPS